MEMEERDLYLMTSLIQELNSSPNSLIESNSHCNSNCLVIEATHCFALVPIMHLVIMVILHHFQTQSTGSF